jgi:hypothetical protein
VALGSDVGASMWRTEGLSAKFLTRPNRVGVGFVGGEEKERILVLGN